MRVLLSNEANIGSSTLAQSVSIRDSHLDAWSSGLSLVLIFSYIKSQAKA